MIRPYSWMARVSWFWRAAAWRRETSSDAGRWGCLIMCAKSAGCTSSSGVGWVSIGAESDVAFSSSAAGGVDNPELGPGEFTDQEWSTTAERMEAVGERIRANPRAAAVEAQTFAEIANRVRTLQAIRKARGLTQQQMSDQLRISQGEVSRIERRGNLHLATLVRFIEATGGKLRITAIFDDEEMEVAVGDLLHAEPARHTGRARAKPRAR